jgi:hypothetical protein
VGLGSKVAGGGTCAVLLFGSWCSSVSYLEQVQVSVILDLVFEFARMR